MAAREHHAGSQPVTRVVVTGLQGLVARMVAGALAAQPGVEVIGIGGNGAVPGIDLHTTAGRGMPLLDLLREAQCDVVIHLDPNGEDPEPGPALPARREHVLPARAVLAACAAAGVRRVLLQSSTFVYGARPDQPFYRDEAAPVGMFAPKSLLQNYVDIERFAFDCAAKHPGLEVVVLRCAGVVGAGATSPLARYLRSPLPRTCLGFDPLLQVLHLDDAATAFALAALVAEANGAYNIAAPDPLPLSRALRLAGRWPLPLPAAVVDVATLVGRAQRTTDMFPFGGAYLRYACLADTRRAHDELGFASLRSAAEAVSELAPRAAPAALA